MNKKMIALVILMVLIVAFIYLNVQDNNNSEIDQGLYQYRTQYIGEAWAVVNMASEMIYPENLQWNGTGLETDAQPYGYRIFFIDKSIEKNKWDVTNPMFAINACTLFSLIENLDYIDFVIAKENNPEDIVTLTYQREWAEDLIGKDLWQATETKESFDELYKEMDEKVNP